MQFFRILYCLISLVDISAELSAVHWLVYISKPCIMVSLIFIVIYSNPNRSLIRKNELLAGMFFALLGDILLMIKGVDLFLPGLGCFLLMQWIYIAVFFKQSVSPLKQKSLLWIYIPFITYAAILVGFLLPHLPDIILKSGVSVYAISIATMGYAAFVRKNRVNKTSFRMVFTGAVLFILSDSVIAVNQFLFPVSLASLWVMGTYAMAQYLIVMGVLNEKLN